MEIGANRVVQGWKGTFWAKPWFFLCFKDFSGEAFSLQRIFPARFLVCFWLFAFVFLVYLFLFLFSQSQALTFDGRRWYKDICICSKRQCAIRALEGGWPCGRSLPRHHFPPSVELAGYDYRTLLNRVLEKSSCKLTKPGFVSRNGVSTQ